MRNFNFEAYLYEKQLKGRYRRYWVGERSQTSEQCRTFPFPADSDAFSGAIAEYERQLACGV